MSRVIWKYPLNPLINTDKTTIEVPVGSKVIHVGCDPEFRACIWIERPEKAIKTKEWNFVMVATGQRLPQGDLKHVGTVLQTPFVWHVYRKGV